MKVGENEAAAVKANAENQKNEEKECVTRRGMRLMFSVTTSLTIFVVHRSSFIFLY